MKVCDKCGSKDDVETALIKRKEGHPTGIMFRMDFCGLCWLKLEDYMKKKEKA